MLDNFPMTMQFVQDEALQQKLFIQNELRTLREFVQDKASEHEAIHAGQFPNDHAIRPGRGTSAQFIHPE